MDKRTYFIDTSALFKRYVEEEGSTVVNQIFDANVNRFISILTLSEVVSNLKRLVEIDAVINNEEFAMVKETFLSEIGIDHLHIIEASPEIVLQSLELCSKQYLAPLDAIQLATALSINDYNPVFLCADHKLTRTAIKLGLETLNPEV